MEGFRRSPSPIHRLPQSSPRCHCSRRLLSHSNSSLTAFFSSLMATAFWLHRFATRLCYQFRRGDYYRTGEASIEWSQRACDLPQGTPDLLLPLLILVCCFVMYFTISRMIRKWRASRVWSPHAKRYRAATPARNRAEFLTKPGKMQPQVKSWNSPPPWKGSSWFGPPVRVEGRGEGLD